MDRQQTLEVVNACIEESAVAMKKKAKELLNARDWDFEHFGDRNSFARLVMQELLKSEVPQYNTPKSDKDIKGAIAGELMYIRGC